MAKCFQKIADGDAEHTVIGTPRFEANQVGVAQLNFGRIFDQKNALVSSPNPIPFPSDLLLSQRPPPAFSLDRLGTGAEEKSDVFPQGRESLCASKWGFCPFRLVYGHADRCAVWASAPCGWSYVKGGLVLTPGQIRSVSPLARNHEEQLPKPYCPQCLPGLLLLLASRENSWPAGAARCSR